MFLYLLPCLTVVDYVENHNKLQRWIRCTGWRCTPLQLFTISVYLSTMALLSLYDEWDGFSWMNLLQIKWALWVNIGWYPAYIALQINVHCHIGHHNFTQLFSWLDQFFGCYLTQIMHKVTISSSQNTMIFIRLYSFWSFKDIRYVHVLVVAMWSDALLCDFALRKDHHILSLLWSNILIRLNGDYLISKDQSI